MGASADGRYLLALTDGGRAEGAHAVALFDTHAPGLDATRPVSHYRSYGPLTWLGAVSPDGLWAVVAEEGLRGAPHRAVILR